MDIVRTALLLLSAYSPTVRCVFVKFDVIVPLEKSFNLIQGHVKSEHYQGNEFCLSQKREIKVMHNTNFSQNREI